MNTFLKTYRLALTPLSPIHIGCGEDFEPTNYVIDDDGMFGPLLYGFDPSRAVLSDVQLNSLSQMGMQANWLGIQQFFRNNKQPFKAISDVLMPVASGLASEYQKKLGKVVQQESDGRDVINKLTIERAMATGRGRIPFIPGSSLKGALRTSDLNRVPNAIGLAYGEDDRKAGSTKLEKRLYEEIDFDMSPMRLIKVSDLMPSNQLERSVVYAVMKRKRFVRDPKTGEEKQTQDNLSTRKEIISHGQFRGLTGDLTISQLGDLPDSENTPKKKFRHSDLVELARFTNDYHLPKLEAELKIFDERRFASEHWVPALNRLLADELKQKFTEGKAFLVRLGRYGGAETKTLDGVRSIHIPQAKRQEEKYVKSSHCLWLAANDSKARSDLLPFGWAVVEIDPKESDLPQLKAWCEAQSKARPDMTQLRQQFEADKQTALQQKAEQAAIAAHRLATKKAEELAAAQRAQALASMTPQGQLIETLRQQCEDWASKMPPHGNFKHQEANIAKAGRFQDANKLVSQALADDDWTANDKQALADMIDACFPKIIAPWGKEERKKLKLAALRGQ